MKRITPLKWHPLRLRTDKIVLQPFSCIFFMSFSCRHCRGVVGQRPSTRCAAARQNRCWHIGQGYSGGGREAAQCSTAADEVVVMDMDAPSGTLAGTGRARGLLGSSGGGGQGKWWGRPQLDVRGTGGGKYRAGYTRPRPAFQPPHRDSPHPTAALCTGGKLGAWGHSEELEIRGLGPSPCTSPRSPRLAAGNAFGGATAREGGHPC